MLSVLGCRLLRTSCAALIHEDVSGDNAILAAAQLSGESRRRGRMTFVPASQVLAVLDDEHGLIVDAVVLSDLPIVFVAL